MTRQASGMAAIPPRVDKCPRQQIGTRFIDCGIARCVSPNTRISAWNATEIAPRILIKKDIRSIESSASQPGRNPRSHAFRCALTEIPYLKRLATKVGLAIAAISFPAPAVAASDVAASAPESGTLAGITRQGTLGELDVWKIPGSELKLLVGSRHGEVLIAKTDFAAEELADGR